MGFYVQWGQISESVLCKVDVRVGDYREDVFADLGFRYRHQG